MDSQRFTRRASLLRFGGLVASAAGIGAGAAEAGSGPAGVASGAVSCVLSPEMTEGPYFIPNEAVRRDITEGKPGAPLRLNLSVVDASTCRAIVGAAVDVWQCDAGGLYSGFIAASTGHGGPGPGGGPTDKQTFLRGVQRTNAKGLAVFDTIYPGWYRGRTVHIHVKVHVGGNVVHTGQLFFPETLTDAVYKRLPYSKRTGRDTRNATDAIFRNGGSRSLLSLSRSGHGYVGSIVMGVHRT